jgi:CheY-like chemotaxis protein
VLRLAVVDDDPLQAEIMRRLLEAHEDVETSIFESAEAALEALRDTGRERGRRGPSPQAGRARRAP